MDTALAIKTLRERSGLMQGSFAALLHTDKETVVNMENGSCIPKPELLERLLDFATAFGADEECNKSIKKSLESVKKPFANMNELICRLSDFSDTAIYVADNETDELLYINETGKKVLKLIGEIPRGNKCYKYLMRRDSPCSFCHKSMLREDSFRENNITFPLNGRQYRIRSRLMSWEGRMLHVHFISDLTNMLNEQKTLRKLTDRIPGGIGIFYVHSDGRIECNYLNDGYYEMLGTSREKRMDYSGFGAVNAVCPEDMKRIIPEIEAAAKGEKKLDCELRAKIDDGSYKWLSVRGELADKTEERSTIYCLFSDIDQLKKTQQALEENKKSFDTMMEHIPGAMVVFEVRNNMLWLRYISESCKDISGFTAEETYKRSGKDPLADAHPESRGYFENHEWSDIQSGKKISYKYQIICKDGCYKWVSLRLSPVFIDGELLYYGVLRDIDADEADQIAKSSKFEQLIARMDNADEEGLIAKGRYDIDTNRILSYERIDEHSLKLPTDTSFDSAARQMIATAALPKQAEILKTELNRQKLTEYYVSGKRDGSIEYQRKRDEGTYFWSQLKYSVHQNPENKHLIFFVYTYDITERVLEDNMIRKLGSIEYDVLGLIDINSHFFESKNIKGVKSIATAKSFLIKGRFEDVIHAQIAATVAPGEQKELEERLKIDTVIDKLTRYSSYYVAFTAHKKDGGYRRKQMNFCYLDESKMTLFYYCNDITEMYDREQEQLRRTEAALESARQANESKTEFFSRMSHDMRTPLNGILGSVSLALDEKGQSTVMSEYLHDIQFSGKFLLNLVNDVLDMSKIESGVMELFPEPYTYSEFISNMTKMIAPLCREKNITLNMNPLSEDNTINVDILRFQQIFFNIFSNAVKYTPEGGTIDHYTEAKMIDDNHMDCKCHIIDNGIGMSKEFQKQLFSPYKREKQDANSPVQGTGLGMSIANKLAHMMGGEITVKSKLGEGTEVIIHTVLETLPMASGEKKSESGDIGTENIRGKNILLCEDHPLNAKIAIKLLEKAGAKVTRAENGELGVNIYANSAPEYFDLILMDIRMPVMDGLEAARRIRALNRPDAAKVPIIAMTANAYREDINKSAEAGMNAHLSKPIESDTMYETISEYLPDNSLNRKGKNI